MNANRAKPVLACMLLPILLDVLFVMVGLHNFTGFSSAFSERAAYFLFWLANWPSLLFKAYPYVLSQEGHIVYEMLGWLNPVVFLLNLITWGLVGFLISVVISRHRHKVS